jgi:hypothetical protein
MMMSSDSRFGFSGTTRHPSVLTVIDQPDSQVFIMDCGFRFQATAEHTTISQCGLQAIKLLSGTREIDN